jgi:hypothetical protein
MLLVLHLLERGNPFETLAGAAGKCLKAGP